MTREHSNHHQSKFEPFYSQALIVASTDKVMTHEGKIIRASTFRKSSFVVSLPQVLTEVTGVQLEGASSYQLYQQIAPLIEKHNLTADKNSQITPIIVRYPPPPSCSFLIFSADQRDSLTQLINQNLETVDPFLPFRVTSEEMSRLKDGDLKMKETIVKRLLWQGYL